MAKCRWRRPRGDGSLEPRAVSAAEAPTASAAAQRPGKVRRKTSIEFSNAEVPFGSAISYRHNNSK